MKIALSQNEDFPKRSLELSVSGSGDLLSEFLVGEVGHRERWVHGKILCRFASVKVGSMPFP
jgi:hypothetical protein